MRLQRRRAAVSSSGDAHVSGTQTDDPVTDTALKPDAPSHAGTSVVVLNYRTTHRTVQAVRSVQSSEPAAISITVVDNASGDGSVDVLRRELPGVRVIAAPENDGFSAGCNLGIRAALEENAARVLLLNSDVVVPAGMIHELERALDEDSSVGIVGPIVLMQHDPGRVESLGIGYSRTTGRMRHAGYGRLLKEVAAAERRVVDGVSGCAMMVRREVFERIGLLAEEYYFGYEDLDFALRAADDGILTACVGTTAVYHEGSASIGGRSPERIYFGTRNQLLLGSRFTARRTFARKALTTAAIILLNAAYTVFSSKSGVIEGLAAWGRGIRDHVRGRYGRRG